MANTERFTYKTRAPRAGQTDFKVLEAPMGDGYTQRAADGINGRVDRWDLTARGLWLDVEPGGCPFAGQDVKGIHDFVLRHEGYKAFEWTAPDGTDALWICRGVAKEWETATVVSLSMTFERTYIP